MKRGVRESVAVSAVLLSALFILPLLVIVPFRSELLTREPPVDETEGEPFVSGDLDGQTVLKVKNGDTVRLRALTDRPLVFDRVAVRVSPDFRTYAHLDFDEANACDFHKGDLGMILCRRN